MALMAFAPMSREDQFSKEWQWDAYQSVPKVLVFAGKEASELATAWGGWLQNTFNPGFEPTKDHLRSLSPKEKVKVIAVATLPDVPRIFRTLFRGGFQKQSASMGVVLDWSSELSRHFGYNAEEKLPKLVLMDQKNMVVDQLSAAVAEEAARRHVELTLRSTLEVGSAPGAGFSLPGSPVSSPKNKQ